MMSLSRRISPWPSTRRRSRRSIRFLEATGYEIGNEAQDVWGRERQPATQISYRSAEAYAVWLSEETGHSYRLPSESEWEYAARAGTETTWSWGNRIGSGRANCAGCGGRWDGESPAPVGSFAPNPWGLHDMHGNVWEMVQDCHHRGSGFNDAPADGSPQLQPRRGLFGRRVVGEDGRCKERVLRGGTYALPPEGVQSAARAGYPLHMISSYTGFRVVREM